MRVKMPLPLIVEELIQETLEHLRPYPIYQREISFLKEGISIKGLRFDLKNNIHLVGVGKASSYEVQALKGIIKGSEFAQRLKSCLVLTKEGNTVSDDEIIQWEGSHPLVSLKNIENSKKLVKILEEIPREDTLFFLLSGGASALLEIPKENVSFEDLKNESSNLLLSGMGINEMNQRRKKLSLVKGGGLLNFIKTRNIIQFITCDIPDENLKDVGSGPLFAEESNIIKLTIKMNSASLLLNYLCQREKRINGGIFDCSLDELISSLKQQLPQKGFLHISGGECPIKIPPKHGKGGRNSHFVLKFALDLFKNSLNRDIFILSLATDGDDGNSGVAGVYINFSNFDADEARKHLDEFNSFEYFKNRGLLLNLGPTQCNVMDLRIIGRI